MRPAPRLLIVFVGLSIFAFLADAVVRGGAVPPGDAAILDFLVARQSPPLDLVMRLASEIGGVTGATFVAAASIAALYALRRLRAALFVVAAFIGAALLSATFKALAGRARPPLDLRPVLDLPGWADVAWIVLPLIVLALAWRTRWRPTVALALGAFAAGLVFDRASASLFPISLDAFPSGHALRPAALVASLCLVTWRTTLFRPALLVGLGVLVAVGISRVYLGYHHPSDVLAGWALGSAGAVALSLVPWLDPLREVAAHSQFPAQLRPQPPA